MLKFARWMDACGIAVPRNADGSLVYKLEIDPRYALCGHDLSDKLPAGFTIDADLLLK